MAWGADDAMLESRPLIEVPVLLIARRHAEHARVVLGRVGLARQLNAVRFLGGKDLAPAAGEHDRRIQP
jgi:hypothetical protein